MNPTELASAFHEGRFVGPSGALVPRRALLTRRSLLLFTDEMVLKLKRPRVVEGVDQSDMGDRYAMVARERWVGQQLNGDVYWDDYVLRVDPASERVTMVRGYVEGEPIVVMRRLPDARRADVLLEESESEVRRGLEQAAVRLARYHATAECYVDGPLGDAARPGQRFGAALERVRGILGGDEHERLRRETSEWLDALQPTFQHRINERRVRMLHREVRLEHIFIAGFGVRETVIVDPSDGRDATRALDTAEDIMGLALELDAVMGADESARVVDAYAAETADASLRKVARFYKRLGCLQRAAEALGDATDGEAGVERSGAAAPRSEGAERARFFVRRALTGR